MPPELEPKDEYCHCFKSVTTDTRLAYSRRDLVHEASVLVGALAVIEELDPETKKGATNEHRTT